MTDSSKLEMIFLLSLSLQIQPSQLIASLQNSWSTRWIQLLGPWVQFLDEHHDFLGRHPCVLGDGDGLLRPVDLARVELCGEKTKKEQLMDNVTKKPKKENSITSCY